MLGLEEDLWEMQMLADFTSSLKEEMSDLEDRKMRAEQDLCEAKDYIGELKTRFLDLSILGSRTVLN
jgi:hypothetical protein